MKHFILISLLSIVSLGKGITLTSDNHVAVRSAINEETIGQVQKDMGTTIASNPNMTEIYMYINSNGGDVFSTNRMIENMMYYQDEGYNISCIASKAISGAFAILQACTNRYITSSSILMQHQMKAQKSGSVENLNTHMDFINELSNNLMRYQAKRMNMTLDDFKDAIKHDWWMVGESGIEHSAADYIVHVGCSHELYQRNTTHTKFSLFGSMKEVYSLCPLITSPLQTIF